jgi:hypothetical protein
MTEPSSSPLRDLITETLANITTTHKCHEKEREILAGRARRIRAVNVVLTALSSTGIITVIVTAQPAAAWATAIVTFCSLLFTLWQLQFQPEVEALAQKEAANEYVRLRNRLRTLLADFDLGHEPSEVRKQYDVLMLDLETATKRAPATSPAAFRLAKSTTPVQIGDTTP